MADPASIARQLAAFNAAVDPVWKSYRANGPGRVDTSLFDGVAEASDTIISTLESESARQSITALPGLSEAWIDEVIYHAKKVTGYAKRCACTPHGLSFITGEAGLIPRKDEIASFESAMRLITSAIEQLRAH